MIELLRIYIFFFFHSLLKKVGPVLTLLVVNGRNLFTMCHFKLMIFVTQFFMSLPNLLVILHLFVVCSNIP